MRLTPAVKNILWVTIGFFLLSWFGDTFLFQNKEVFEYWFGLHYWSAEGFRVWQPVTYMLMHANFNHIFCNLLAVWCFGPAVEQFLGTKRFYWFYLISGIGAAVVQEVMWTIQLAGVPGAALLADQMLTIGASGAVFGILLAFGWFFPDEKVFLLFIPIPIRSRIFVTLYGLFELFAGISARGGDNVAHFAHLGGMLFAWLLLLWWKEHPSQMSNEPTVLEKLKRWWKDRKRRQYEPHHGTFHYQKRVDDSRDSRESRNSRNSSRPRTPEVDHILDKIKAHGYGSLTEEEKRKLFENN